MLKISNHVTMPRRRPVGTSPVHSSSQLRHSPELRTLVHRDKRYVSGHGDPSSVSSFNQQLFEWAKARTQAMTFDVSRINDDPRATDTVLLPPWRTVLVPKARVEDLKFHVYHYCSPSIWMWKIGYGRPVGNCNPYDVNPGAIDHERMTRRPGKGHFDSVARGAYGNRNFKYLWAIDHEGMHIAREMTPCKLSSRGVITHSILVDKGINAGEIFFDLEDPTKVFINFGSTRLPMRDVREAEHTAEFLLALNYQTVVAMIPNRDLQQSPYGMSDRYGPHVQNMVFKLQDKLEE
jgi:hypothetical protein